MTPHLRRLNKLRHLLGHRLFAVLDSEGVAFFQALVYIHLAVGAVYCAVVAQSVPVALQDALGPAVDTLWVLLCAGAMICLVGKILSARPDRRQFWVHTTGLHLQLAGDFFALGAFASYVMSTVQENEWGKALIAVWVFGALAECAFFLCWRDVRRISQAERTVRRRKDPQ